MNLLTGEERSVLRQAFFDVTQNGQQLSSSVDLVFRILTPDEDRATYYRSLLFQSIRYNDFEGTLNGLYEGGPDPDRMYLPDWLRNRLLQSLGSRFRYFLTQSLTDAPAFIRVNTLKTTVESLIPQIRQFKPSVVNDECILVKAPFGLFRSEAFAQGYFEQQDINSQRVSLSVDANMGMRIVDSCAGSGGKTLHLASLMKNRGTIIALDINADKLDVLRERATRAGVDIIDKRHVTSTKIIKRIGESADRVLIDAPCTGTGVLRRNPDIVYHLTESALYNLLSLQKDILRRNAMIAKSDARVVYATCSVLKEEGEQQVSEFIHQHSDFVLAEEWSTLPGDDGGDGFYCAVLTRSAHA